MSKKLIKARKYEKEISRHIQGKKPIFHVVAPIGWINDPNGFSWYEGKCHLFCQYHPYSTQWGPMHWAHYCTKDMISWELLPCAMAPDESYDSEGCFSGSALVLEKDHILMYTAVSEKTNADGQRYSIQQQAIAIGDGEQYQKLEQNPVITSDMLPEGCSRKDFRDPKIWEENGIYYALIANQSELGEGQVLLYSSRDIRHWIFVSVFDNSGGKYGKMWECPDFFCLDGQELLLVCPQFMQADGLAFHNGNNAVYFIGKRDAELKKFIRSEAKQIDYGTDFYAPQTTLTPDGRRILIGWMQNWDNRVCPDSFNWCGMMTIPRELSLQNGCLLQTPIRELLNYRTQETKYSKVVLSEMQGEVQLDGVSGRCLDLTVIFTTEGCLAFKIKLASDGKKIGTYLSLDIKKGILSLDRTYSGMRQDVLTSRSMYTDTCHETVKLRILMDYYSIEVFANSGKDVMSMLIYTPIETDKIAFSCEGETEITVEKYNIEVKK